MTNNPDRSTAAPEHILTPELRMYALSREEPLRTSQFDYVIRFMPIYGKFTVLVGSYKPTTTTLSQLFFRMLTEFPGLL